jgi:hypothetical protein
MANPEFRKQILDDIEMHEAAIRVALKEILSEIYPADSAELNTIIGDIFMRAKADYVPSSLAQSLINKLKKD